MDLCIAKKATTDYITKLHLLSPLYRNKNIKNVIHPKTATLSAEAESILVKDFCTITETPPGSLNRPKIICDMAKLHYLLVRLEYKLTKDILKERYYIDKPLKIEKTNLDKIKTFIAFHKGSSSSDAFSDFNFSADPRVLKNVERKPCHICGQSSQLYCINCFVPMDNVCLPTLNLPLNFFILYDKRLSKSKSTSLQAKVLAPANVTIIPVHKKSKFLNDKNMFDPSDTVVLFPSPDSVGLTELVNFESGGDDKNKTESVMSKNKAPVLSSLKNVVVIEATWTKARPILNSDLVRSLTKVKIEKRETLYWHFQKHGKDFLSTIEAIYYLLKDFDKIQRGDAALGGRNFDDLLILFAKEYHTIRGKLSGDIKRPPKSWEVVSEAFLRDFE